MAARTLREFFPVLLGRGNAGRGIGGTQWQIEIVRATDQVRGAAVLSAV